MGQYFGTLALLVLFALLPNINGSFFKPARTTVSIVNHFGNTSETLTVHCKSKNDDLGVRTIGYKGSYSWTFRVNLFKTTLYYCTFNVRGVSATFDIYKAGRDFKSRCPKFCEWWAFDNGLTGWGEGGNYDRNFHFDWPKNPWG